MPVRDPLGATVAALGRANGPWEGGECAGRRGGGVGGGGGGGGVGVGGVGPFAAQGLWAPVTDGWPPHWVAVATRSVVMLIRGVDSDAKIKRHCGR